MTKRFLFLLTSLMFAVGASSFAQPSDFEGVWVLQEVELYQYSGTDSIKTSNDLLSADNAFNTHSKLFFSNDKCEVDLDGYLTSSPFTAKEGVLKLYYSPAPVEYEIIERSEKLVLYHRYFAADPNDQEQTIQYGAKLTYQK